MCQTSQTQFSLNLYKTPPHYTSFFFFSTTNLFTNLTTKHIHRQKTPQERYEQAGVENLWIYPMINLMLTYHKPFTIRGFIKKLQLQDYLCSVFTIGCYYADKTLGLREHHCKYFLPSFLPHIITKKSVHVNVQGTAIYLLNTQCCTCWPRKYCLEYFVLSLLSVNLKMPVRFTTFSHLKEKQNLPKLHHTLYNIPVECYGIEVSSERQMNKLHCNHARTTGILSLNI